MRAVSLYGGEVVTAIPMGKSDVSYQKFEARNAQSSPKLTTFQEFLEFARSNAGIEIIAEASLHARLLNSKLEGPTLTCASENLAFYVGLAALKESASGILEPLFVKAA